MLTACLLFALLAVPADPALTFCCDPRNDLFKLAESSGRSFARYDSADAGIRAARPGSGILILDGKQESEESALTALRKGLRQYIELSAGPADQVKKVEWERAFVTSNAFGSKLLRGRILSIGRRSLIHRKAANPLLSVGRVAGFDSLAFGPPTEAYPLLWADERESLIASAPLSNFITGRYSPGEAWKTVWNYIFDRLGAGKLSHFLDWRSSVRPTYLQSERPPANYELLAQRRAADWFMHSHLILDERALATYPHADRWNDRVGPGPRSSGDGRYGMLEGFASQVDPAGTQPARWYRRADCNAESAMALALAGNSTERQVASRLADFIAFESPASQGVHVDPWKASYGLVGWNDIGQGLGIYYGDDNARFILGLIGASGGLHSNRWDELITRCIIANFRTCGLNGFRGDSLNEADLERFGWRHYFMSKSINLAPHFEAYLWACYLWAYGRTRFRPLLERTERAIQMVMRSDESAWTWTNGLQQERARMLLPLAWLVQVDNTHEHRLWLDKMVEEVLAHQVSCGALREEIGDPAHGIAGPPRSNEAYGTAETPMIQENGDPLADMLYTSNFALLGLHEAWSATNRPDYRKAEDRLAQFLCRIQVRSVRHPELDGAWFRAFDYGNWDYWASNGDLGWGAWSVETGWSVSWITTVLALRTRHESLWSIDLDYVPQPGIIQTMLPR